MSASAAQARISAPFRVQQTPAFVAIVVDVRGVLEESLQLRVTRRFFSLRFTARPPTAAEGERSAAADASIGPQPAEVRYELCSEVGLAAAGHRLSPGTSRVRLANMNIALLLAKAPPHADALWPEDAMPTARSAAIALSAILKSEAKQLAIAAVAAEAAHERTWRLRACDLGISLAALPPAASSDATGTPQAPQAAEGALCSPKRAATSGSKTGAQLASSPAGSTPGGQLVPSLSSLFPTDPRCLAQLQVRPPLHSALGGRACSRARARATLSIAWAHLSRRPLPHALPGLPPAAHLPTPCLIPSSSACLTPSSSTHRWSARAAAA
jgi:hypothetical protein